MPRGDDNYGRTASTSGGSSDDFGGFPVAKIIYTVVGVVVALVMVFQLAEHLGAGQVMVVQAPFSGKLTWHVAPGVKWQGFGTVTKYPRRAIYEFSCSEYKDADKRECSDNATDRRIAIRFNDGGHGKVDGSIQYEMPLDIENLTELHKKFGSPEAIQRQLVETTVNKSIYMTGPLMSSKESFADRRNDLIRYVEDQVERGVYQTRSREAKERDTLSGIEKTVRIVEIAADAESGKPLRQESGQLTKFGLKPFNFSIARLPYDAAVEGQIKQQQALAMNVQTAIAEAKQAEQRAITVAKEGEANAAKAKWEQEVIKAQKVTEAQQKLEVANLERQAAEQDKLANILRGEGEARRRQLVMQADGALEIKLGAYKAVNELYANALKEIKVPLVPTIQTGGATGGSNPVLNLMELLQVKTARDLALDVTPGGSR